MWSSRLILLSGFLLLYIRLYWGIDFTDESYMVLNAVGPLLGAKPFVADLMISQTGSLLMLPFAWLFKFFRPDLAGVVLYFRHLYFAAAVLCALVVFRALRGKLSESDRALTSLLPLVLIPACQPVPSYNSLVMFLGLAGQMCFLIARPKRAGLLHALASFAHPAFLACAAATAVTALWSRVKGDFRGYMTGALLFVGLGLALWMGVGGENLRTAFDRSLGSSTFGGGDKLAMMGGEFLGYWRRPLLAALWAGACALTGLAGRLNWAVALGGFAVTQDFLIPEDVAYGLQQRFVCYGLYAVFLILVDRRGWRDAENRAWMARLFAPSFVAGLAIAWTSSNGLVMAPIGWMGCYVYAFMRMLKHRPPQTPALREWRWAVQTAAALFILVQAQVFTLTHFYRDDALSKLDTRVEEGPFRGLYTTHQRRNFIAEFSANMTRLERGGTIFIYDLFAAGYLLSPLVPNGPSYMPILPQWMPQTRAPLVQYFQNPAHWPTYVVEFFYFPFGAENLAHVNPRDADPVGDPFKNFFLRTGQFETVFDSVPYRILRRVN